jgi:WD40 repeat protein
MAMNVAGSDAAAGTAVPEDTRKVYDAFVSYAHEADTVFAPVLQRGLQHLAKPWNRRRAMEVFRDESSLAVSPGLWPSIRAALDASRWLVVLASPEAARSEWVGKEVMHWVSSKGTDHLLVVVTDGSLIWDGAEGELSPTSTAWNPELRGVFPVEPRYLDMAWARGATGLTLRNARFRDQIATLAAAIRETPKEEIEGEDVRQQRRTRRIVQAVIATLTVLVLLASGLAVVANIQRQQAIRESAIALSRQLAAEGLAIDPTDPVIARRLAVAAWRVFPTTQAASAMTTLLTEQKQAGILPTTSDPVTGVTGVTFNPDGNLLASMDGNGTVRFWDPATGQPAGPQVPVPAGISSHIAAVAFSPDGKLLAGADSKNGTVRLWDLATGRQTGAPLHASLPSADSTAMAFSPDSKLLAIADGSIVRLWDPRTGRPVGAPLHAAGPPTGLVAVAFSPDGKLLASTDGTMVLLWDLATGRPAVAPIHAPGNATGVGEVAFSPDGKLLATAGSGDGTVRLWDPATGRPVGAPLHASSPSVAAGGAAFSPDGKLLATAGGDGTLRLWNPLTGRPVSAPIQAATGTAPAVYKVAFSPDGKLLATAGSDGTVRLWDALTGQPAGEPIHAAPPAPDTATGHYGGATAVAFSPDGKLLASGTIDGTIQLWDPLTGHLAGAPIHAARAGTAMLKLAFSPDGKLLASEDGNGTVRLWDLATSKPVGAPLQIPSPAFLGGLAFSPDGKLLAGASQTGALRLWDVVTGEPAGTPLHTRYTGGVGTVGVAFSKDGKLVVSADGNSTVYSWDPVTGRAVGAPLHGPGASFLWDAVAFSPDGKLLATAGGTSTVQLWDPVTGQAVTAPITATAGSLASVNGVAFSPDGKLLATAGTDGTVRVWAVAPLMHPYATLCTDVGPPTNQNWAQYALGGTPPKACT